MPISPNFSSVLTQEWKVNFLQCYPTGYMKHTALCNVLQLTAALHAELGGISFTDMQVHDQAWVLSRMRVEITEMPKWRDVITVKTWIHSLANSRSIRCLEVFLGSKKIIGCETFWAVFNTTSRRPEALALPFDHFALYPERATEVAMGRIDLPPVMAAVGRHTVVLSDLDIVNHANSVKYLEWCLDAVPMEVVAQQHISSIEMNYLKEVSWQETVDIHQSVEASGFTFALKREDKACFALQLVLQK
jgi:medium-chain acyl-[acyl-carrier-protein] hydrolase